MVGTVIITGRARSHARARRRCDARTAPDQQRTSHQPIGWRSCTQSPNGIELLMQHGYLEQQLLLARSPFVWESNGRHLIELPRHARQPHLPAP
jgi:hypothetical protein